jgi:hypothetical protein
MMSDRMVCRISLEDANKVDRASYLETAHERSDEDGKSIESVIKGVLYTLKLQNTVR